MVALSTTKVEYITSCMASCEDFQLSKLFSELFENVLDTNVIFYNNHSGIHLLDNLVFHERSKNIDIRYHFIWDKLQLGAIKLYHS